MASIEPRTGRSGTTTYRVAFRDAGKQRSASFDDLRTAERFRRDVERMGAGPALEMLGHRTANVAKGVPLLKDWTAHHIEHLTGVTPGTRREYQLVAARTFLPHLGELPVDVITRDHVARWVNAQAETVTNRGTLTRPKTIATAQGLLHAVLESATTARHREGTNPSHKMRLPRGEKYEPRFLSQEEFHRLLAAVPEKWRPMVLTIGHTGLRWGEVTALTWADVDLDAHPPALQVRRAWKKAPNGRELGEPKSRRSRRTLGLSSDVVAALRPLRGAPDAFVFPGRQGAAVSHTHWHPSVWRPATTAAGLPGVRIHDLRHSFASWLLTSGHDIYSVSVALGHESIATTTGVYGHIAPDQHALTAAAIGRILTRQAGPGDVLDAEVVGVPELEA